MGSFARFSVAALILSTSAASIAAQQRVSRLDGAWRHVRTQIVAPDSAYERPPLQGMGVISGRRFSQTWVVPGRSGVQQASQPTTAGEKAARYDVLIANAGTLDIRDSVITFRYEQAKNPRIVGTNAIRRYRLRGDTLWLMGESPSQKDSTKLVRFTDTFVRMR
jgi:hypothetical protein